MKILVVDDHPIVRSGLRRLLADDPEKILREATTAAEAMAALRSERPDLVILDLNLPGIGGFEILRRLQSETPPLRILVLSMHDDPLYALRALEAGARGYVSKNAPPVQLLEAIARISQGGTYVSPELAQELALFSARAPQHPLKDLSRRELDLLRLLGEGSSLQQIADALGLSYKTVANNCALLKTKLGVRSNADLVRVAIQNGVVAGT